MTPQGKQCEHSQLELTLCSCVFRGGGENGKKDGGSSGRRSARGL